MSAATKGNLLSRREYRSRVGPTMYSKSLSTAKFDDARLLRAFLLHLFNRAPLLLALLRSSDIDCALRCDFKCQGHASKREQESVSHFSENESDISPSLGNPRGCRHLP